MLPPTRPPADQSLPAPLADCEWLATDTSMFVHCDDASIYYEVLGDGPSVVLLHAFPLNHQMWLPIAERLATRYRIILLDLRGHGLSETGSGGRPATIDRHAADVACVCAAAGVGKAIFGGVSLGGYILFELWRRMSERVEALILADTRAQADTDVARRDRLTSAEEVEQKGPGAFLDRLLPRIIGQTTQAARPDLVAAARSMMSQMTVAGIAAVQRGMAARPDSVQTIQSINVPTLLLFGEEDVVTPVAEGEFMRKHLANSALRSIPRAGHLAVFEQPEEAHEIIGRFLATGW